MINSLLHSMKVCPEPDKKYPYITHGKGVYLYDQNGHEYIDVSSGSSAVNLGHGIESIAEIIREQTSRISLPPTHAFSSEITEKYLDKLIRFSPKGSKRAWLVMSGTDAVENALKLSLQYQQLIGQKTRYKTISRWNSYHGNSVFTLGVGGMVNRRQTYSQWIHDFPHVSPVYTYRKPEYLSESEYCDHCIKELIECIEKNDPKTIASLIMEPVVGAALGGAVPPSDYFKEVRKICDFYGIVFISDEVMTGFGRLGKNFGIEKFGVQADIIASGKGISGGYYPLSAIIINEKICLPFEQANELFLASHTFACNPVGAAVGNFVIDHIIKENLINNAHHMGNYFKDQLARLYELDIVGDIRGEGLMIGIEFVKDKINKQPFPKQLQINKLIFNEALKRGIVIYPGNGSIEGKEGDHTLLLPPLCINKNEIDQIVEILEDSIKTVESIHKVTSTNIY